MTGRVRPRTAPVAGVIRSRSGPGNTSAHTGPPLVAGWRDGRRDVRLMTGLLLRPVAMLRDRALGRPVCQCHTHIVAALGRRAGRRAHPGNDDDRAGDALRAAGAACGLPTVARATRAGVKSPARAADGKAARAGRAGPGRITVQRHVAAVAARDRTGREFVTEPARRDLRVRPGRYRPGEVTGYAVALPGDRTAAGPPVWSGGGTPAGTGPCRRCAAAGFRPGPASDRPGPFAGQPRRAR